MPGKIEREGNAAKIPALTELTIGIKGGGDLATGIAVRLFRSGFTRIFIMEVPAPTTIRRQVAFASALYEGKITVEGITAVTAKGTPDIHTAWKNKTVPVLADPEWASISGIRPDVLVDAVIAKKNLGTQITDAPLTIALGPGFTAGRDVDAVIETRRGHDLGRVIREGNAQPNTSRPEAVKGFSSERLLRSPGHGIFTATARIGDHVTAGQILGHVDKNPVRSGITGVIRGLIRDGLPVTAGRKIGDVDPRNDTRYCGTVSDKARSLGGAILEVILDRFNR
ncbi:MAG: EF2563 family selenium-dependent molybdenum hydroxylase system protein [Desulfobacterales bacterium]|nr:EF2563 family selenium-dependent molybdenum hydroxylase system protein [Desulfobacterales bacterium]